MTDAKIPRRRFLQAASTVAGGLAIAGSARDLVGGIAAAERVQIADLPKGDAPNPLSFPHFPDRLHAFVWRNWPLVPYKRIARVVGARPSQIAQIAKAMGLGVPPRIDSDQSRRSYLTIIKRNWHLLPYEQLLQLLD